VHTEGRHQNRAASAVVAGIDNVLNARSHIEATPEVRGVIALHDVFSSVAQRAVAEKEPEASVG